MAGTADREDPISKPPSMFQRRPALAWLPIPALLALMVGLWVADWQVAWPQPFLYAVIHYAVAIAAVALIVIPAAGGFLANGQASLLMLGCGVLATDIGAAGAGLGFGRSLDTGFAIYNPSVLFSALCHLAGVTLASQRQTRVRPAATWLAGAYAGAVGVMGLVIWAAFAGRMPAFFIPGQGSTALRSMVVGLGAGGFALTARLLWRAHRRVPSPFLYWYALGLMLIAAGLTGSLVIALKDSPLQWVTRLTQSLGSIYLCVAALAAWR